MGDSWFLDANLNGVLDDFFKDPINGLDFALEEDIEANDAGEDWVAKFQNLEPPPFNVLAGLSSGPHSEISNGSVKVMRTPSVSNHASPRKQWSSGAEASSSKSIPNQRASSKSVSIQCDLPEGKYSKQFRTSSPVSVLESSSGSCTGGNQLLHYPKFVPVKRPRSKCLRNRRQTHTIFSFFSSSKNLHRVGFSWSDLESHLGEKSPSPAKKRQRKRKPAVPLSSDAADENSSPLKRGEVRKCTHCQVSRTPQWREGPLGPKTLCNACGVRYRSGRLFPEYRPAASPTFMPSAHSNSHRKVLEMRKKTLQLPALDAAPVN